MNREQIQQIRIDKKLDDKLLEFKGVIGVDIDHKQVKGEKTDKLSITAYVKKKLTQEELSAGEAVPEKIEGIPTDVIECLNVWPSTEMSAEMPRQEPESPSTIKGHLLAGGLSISNQSTPLQYGTLGIVLISEKVPVALSCAHTMVTPPSDLGIIEPSGTNGGIWPRDSIGTVKLFSYGMQNVDAAYVPIQNRPSDVLTVANIGKISNYGNASVGVAVRKMGATTGLRQGVVSSITTTWQYTTGLGTITLYNQIKVDNVGGVDFALPGDSGSAVIDPSLLMVGMVVAGTPGQFTICNNSADIYRATPDLSLNFSKEQESGCCQVL